MSNGKQLCKGRPCQFFYYIIQPQLINLNHIKNYSKQQQQQQNQFSQKTQNKWNNSTVFLVSGMHGNQYIGPLSLLYGLKHFKSSRIIIFPLANPSGYQIKSRRTSPSNIDPNRDYPIEDYSLCYQASATKIIDYIYRNYRIDLTIAIHNGLSQIGWNWGTKRQTYNSHTSQFTVYQDMGQMLKFYGGANSRISMEQFQIGTMNQVIYPVMGTFDDWAYAGSWYKPTKRISSPNCQYKHYPPNMTRSLVFLLQVGPFDVVEEIFGNQIGVTMYPNSKNLSNGYISRTIRMVSEFIKVLNPRLQVKFTNKQMFIKLQGCKKGYISNLIIYDQNNKIFYKSFKSFQMAGTINQNQIQPNIIPLIKEIFEEQNISKKQTALKYQLFIQYQLDCDPSWIGKGQTLFSQKRLFKIKQRIYLEYNINPTIQRVNNFYRTSQQALKSLKFIQQKPQFIFYEIIQQHKNLLVIGLLIIVMALFIGFLVLMICKDLKKSKIKIKQKLEKQLVSVSLNELSTLETLNNQIQIDEQNQNENYKKNIKKDQFVNAKTVKETMKYPYLYGTETIIKEPQNSGQILQLQQFVNKYYDSALDLSLNQNQEENQD